MVVTKFIKIEKLLLIIWVLLFRMEKIPWYYGRTVGAKYGQNKRLIQAVAKRRSTLARFYSLCSQWSYSTF